MRCWSSVLCIPSVDASYSLGVHARVSHEGLPDVRAEVPVACSFVCTDMAAVTSWPRGRLQSWASVPRSSAAAFVGAYN